ncbi:MAG: ComF family protein [Clostridiales bacterium]|nr:ComF family protein [Clostridiales bacterium]
MNLLRAIYPERAVCVACGRPSEGEFLCEECGETLEELRLEGAREGGSYRYDGVAKRLVHRLKFDNVTAAATVLARAMALDVMKMNPSPDTVVTWVTMPDKRKRIRGIDHGQVLARAVGLRLKLPVRRLLIRSDKHPLRTQRGATRAERLRNLTDLFTPEEELPRDILLVDDVITTGATMETCCACLRRAGAHVLHLSATKVD